MSQQSVNIEWCSINLKKELTAPAQKISLGHQACFGGSGASEGNREFNGAVGLGTEVEMVTISDDVEIGVGFGSNVVLEGGRRAALVAAATEGIPNPHKASTVTRRIVATDIMAPDGKQTSKKPSSLL